MSAPPSADNQPAPVIMEAVTTTSAIIPTQLENDNAPQIDVDSETEGKRERWAKSSSPLSQYDDGAKGERSGQVASDEEDAEGYPQRQPYGEDVDEDMDMDTDEDFNGKGFDDMDIVEDEEDEEQDNQNQERPADRVSESTTQPHHTPSSQRNHSPDDYTPRREKRMERYIAGSDHEDGDENNYDDDADERHSSVTSSTIPLTSLDDSPNQRHGATERRADDERHHHLVTSSSSEVLQRQSHLGNNIVESSTLSSLSEAHEVPPRSTDIVSHHDEDLTDLSESEGEDGNEDEEADEDDNEDPEEDDRDENGETGEEEDEDVEEDEENGDEQHDVTRKRQAATNPISREKPGRTSQSPSLSPPSSVISLHQHNDEQNPSVNDGKIDGIPLGPHQNMTLTSTNGDEAKSPNKTLKLTLKLSRSPPDATSKDDVTEMPKQEQKPRSDNDNQDAEQSDAVSSAQKSNPAPTSHGRKPSIFGSNTVEDEQQQEQDDVEHENGDLSEDEDEPAGKKKVRRETAVASHNKPTAIEEESTEYSDAEEADAQKPQAKPSAKAKPTLIKASNQNTSSQTTSHPLDRPPSTLSSAPSQPTLEALAALLKIEIKFAALRDQLYIERMNEITKEEEMVTNGTHRSLMYLHNILEARHDNLLRLADLRQKEFEVEAVRVRDWDKKTCMSWWNDSKDQLIKHEYESNARKRRRIEKDKHDFDMPKPVPKPLPPKTVTAQDRQARAFDWNAGPSITPLNTHEISNDLLAMGIGNRVPYRNVHVPALAGMVPAQINLAPYGRNQALIPTVNGGRMPYPGEEMLLSDNVNGLGHLDPSQHRQASSHHHHHHHHHHHPVPPATGPSHRAQQPPRQHQPYSSGVPIMDQTIYGQAQAQARREGRQIPTSMDAFDAGRRRDRVPEDMDAGTNGVISGPGNHRGEKHRRQLAEHSGDFGSTDGPTTKKRKTGSDGYQLQASANPSRSLLDVKVEMAESGVDPRLTATAAAGSLIHHRSASPQHTANARRELALPNPPIGSVPGMPASSQGFNHPPSSAFGAPQPVSENNTQISSSNLSAGPQQQPATGQPTSLTGPAGSISQQQQPTTGSWGYRFPSGATPGMPSAENRNRFLAGMATARN